MPRGINQPTTIYHPQLDTGAVGAGSDGDVQSPFSASSPVTKLVHDRMMQTTGTGNRNVVPTQTISAGKYFWEVETPIGFGEDCYAGLIESSVALNVDFRSYSGFGQRLRNAPEVSLGTNTLGVIANTAALSLAAVGSIQIYADLDNKEVWIGRGGNTGTGNPATRTNPHFYGWTGTPSFLMFFTAVYSGMVGIVFPTPQVGSRPPGYRYVGS